MDINDYGREFMEELKSRNSRSKKVRGKCGLSVKKRILGIGSSRTLKQDERHLGGDL